MSNSWPMSSFKTLKLISSLGGPIPNLQTGRIVEGSGSDDNEHLRRVLKNVTKDDSGGYRCTLTNTVGSANRDFFLFVHYGINWIMAIMSFS